MLYKTKGMTGLLVLLVVTSCVFYLCYKTNWLGQESQDVR